MEIIADYHEDFRAVAYIAAGKYLLSSRRARPFPAP